MNDLGNEDAYLIYAINQSIKRKEKKGKKVQIQS